MSASRIKVNWVLKTLGNATFQVLQSESTKTNQNGLTATSSAPSKRLYSLFCSEIRSAKVVKSYQSRKQTRSQKFQIQPSNFFRQ